LSPGEIAYYQTYIESIDRYNQALSESGNIGGGSSISVLNLDLTVDMTPPKELFIEVRVK
jgi:hypothetical protein